MTATILGREYRLTLTRAAGDVIREVTAEWTGRQPGEERRVYRATRLADGRWSVIGVGLGSTPWGDDAVPFVEAAEAFLAATSEPPTLAFKAAAQARPVKTSDRLWEDGDEQGAMRARAEEYAPLIAADEARLARYGSLCCRTCCQVYEVVGGIATDHVCRPLPLSARRAD